MVYSQRQVAGLQAHLGNQFRVVLGMTYGAPSVPDALTQLETEGIDRVLVLPMYPQYSSTTTASVMDAVFRAAAGPSNARKRFVPTLRFVPPYYNHPGYIAALKDQIMREVATTDHTPDKFIFSFHGIPERYANTGDPYPEQCTITAQLLAEALALAPDQWFLSYQSRFGPETWLQPYTDEVLESLHAAGAKNVLVAAPGFVADCLETLDELGHEGREQFVTGGGAADQYRLAPCLNDNTLWIAALVDIVRRETAGWHSHRS